MASTKDSRRNKRGANGAAWECGKSSPLTEIDMIMQDAIAGVPSAKKRSLLLPEDRENDELLEDQEIDHEKAKTRIRKQQLLVNSTKKTEAECQELNSNLLTGLTTAELENHYSQCIQLCNRNKVNVKNAFKLQLIDYMKLIFANQSKKTENLALMGFTLDASAKIYSYRVDKVYTDIMKIMSGKFFKETDNNEKDVNGSGDDSQEENDETAEGGYDQLAKKKKGMNKKCDGHDELDFTKMTCSETELRKAQNDAEGLLKSRITVHQEFFVECQMAGPHGLYMLNAPIFGSKEEGDEEAVSNRITLGGNRVTDYKEPTDISDCIPDYKNVSKNFFVIGETGETQVENHALVYDSTVVEETSTERMRAYTKDDDVMCPDVVEAAADYDDGFSDDEHDFPVASNNLYLCNSIKSNYSIKGLSSLVTANANELSFFNSGKLSTLAGPSHWHVKRRKLDNAHAPIPGTTRKENAKKNASLDLINDILSPKLAQLEEQDKPMSLVKKTVKTWTRDRNRTVPNTFKMREFVCMITNKSLYMKKAYREGSITADVCSEGDVEVRTLVLLDNPEAGGLDVSDSNNHQTYLSLERLDDGNGEPRYGSGSDLQLLPEPPKVNRINMNYAKTQKKVDIKLLKDSIWDLMDLENGKKTDKISQNAERQLSFSDVFLNVPRHLPPEEAAQLSPGIVFMAVLHMANEKNLSLNQEIEDITISLG